MCLLSVTLTLSASNYFAHSLCCVVGSSVYLMIAMVREVSLRMLGHWFECPELIGLSKGSVMLPQ